MNGPLGRFQLSFILFSRRATLAAALGLLSWLPLTSVSATCLNPPGDVNGNGITNVADAQCTFLGALWQIEVAAAQSNGQPTPPPPSCAFGGPSRMDLNCDGAVTVPDTQICVFMALGIPLPSNLDANGNQCHDTCEALTALCGNGVLEIGEQCDDGFGNSDTLADFCRTNCQLPKCGDGVIDTGEQCDDGNTTSSDGCEPNCTFSGSGAFPLPYVQPFSSTSFGAMSWTVDSDAGSASNNWTLVTSGPLGPDLHPRFFTSPTVTNYVDRISSPLLNATGAQYVTLTFDNAISVAAGATAATTFKVLASGNGGTSWTTVWLRTGAEGNLAAGKTVVDVSAALAGSAQARIAFEIAGPTSAHITFWEIDQVEVRVGAPPVVALIPNQSLTAGTTATVTVLASDLDTPPANLSFSLVGAPGFASILTNGDGTATLTLAPTVAQTGNFPNVAVRCSDGTFTVDSFFDIFVAPSPGSVPAFVTIRNAAGGQGQPVDNVNMEVGQNLALFCAAYNSSGTFLSDTPCTWTRTGTIPLPTAGPAASIIYQPNATGSGFITATPTNSGVTADQTGTITVSLPANAGVNLATSTVAVSPNAIEANGTSTATVTVTAFNTLGLPITGATVVINTTAGTLQGSVTEVGNGVYTRVIRSSSSVGTAAITATVNGTALTSSAQLSFVNFFTISGTSTVWNCDNIAEHTNKNIVVQGTLTINSNPTAANPNGCAAQMKFGDIIVQNGGTLTHSPTTASQEFWMDIEVKSLIVEAGGNVNVTGRGYLGAVAGGIGYWFGNTNSAQLGVPADEGGSHGGLGGRAPFARAYGSMFDPRTLGGGAGRNVNWGTAGGNGGGVIRIKSQNTIVVHGTVQADGNPGPSTGSGGGAGGSIMLDTPALGGSGTIRANGGQGNSTSTFAAGGGGGGRIAIRNYTTLSGNFAPANVATNVQCRGTTGGVNGGAGTIFFMPASGMQYGWLLVNNNGITTPAQSTPILLVPEGIASLIDGTSGVLTDFAALWRTNWYVGTFVNPNVSQPGSAQGPGNVQLFRVVDNSDIDLQLTGSVPLSSVASSLSTYRGVLALDRLDILGNAALAVPGDVLVNQGNQINPVPGAVNWTGRIDAAMGSALYHIDLNVTDTVNVTNGGLRYGDLFGSDNPVFPFNFSLNNSLIQTDLVPATQFVASNSSVISVTSLSASGAVNIANSTTTASTLSGLDVTLQGGTSTLGAASASNDLTLNGNTCTTNTLAAGRDVVLDGNASVTIREENVTAGRRVDLRSTSVLRHEDIAAGGPLERLNITAQSVIVGAAASIDVTGRGFRGAPTSGSTAWTIGNTQLLAATNTMGGSHGGLGGAAVGLSGSAPLTHAYGSVFEPVHAGGGGGFDNQGASQPGGHGGGVVRIQASALVRVDGAIRANGNSGANGTWGGGGGAGGSIWITTQQLAGAGSIEANGGNGGTTTSGSGGGGGGRIAVRGYAIRTGAFAGSGVVTALQARGGLGGASGNRRGGAGTIFLQTATQTFGDLLVDNGGNVPPKASTPILVAPQGVIGALSGSQFTDGGAGVQPNRFAGSWVNANVAQNGVNAPINGQTFFYVTGHDFSTFTTTGSAPLASVAAVGDTYRGVLPLERLEVRGRASLGVAGDMLVQLGGMTSTDPTAIFLGGEIVTQRVDFNNASVINADGGGLEANTVFSAGATPNSLNLNLTNSSVITLPALNSGGIISTSSTLNIGGPIVVQGAMTLTSSTLNAGNVTLTGAGSFTSSTVTAGDLSANSLVFDGGTITLNRATAAGDIELRGTGNTVTINEQVVQAGAALRLLGNAQLRSCKTSITKVCTLDIAAASLFIETNAAIDVSARGYLGSTASSVPAFWNGNVSLGGANNNEGGSHGGYGGQVTLVNRIYGSLFDPRLPGAGAGYSTNAGVRGGDGGGAVRIVLSQFAAIDGSINANGEPALHGSWGTGGAGGSVSLTTPSLGGNGFIRANGGAGGNQASVNAGGGGGRIAIRGLNTHSGAFSNTNIYNNVLARGGSSGGPSTRGGAGTIYIFRQGQQFGDLIVDNGGTVTSGWSTPVRVLPQSVVSSVGPGNTMGDASANWATNQFAGSRVNPNVAQPASSTGLTQQAIYLIQSNGESTLTLAGSPQVSTVASAGSSYRGVLALDNLEIRGAARMEVNGDVMVMGGDLATANTTTLALGGLLKGNWVDLNQVNQINLNGGGIEANKLFANLSETPAINWNMTGGAVNLPAVTSGNFTMNGGTITTGNWGVTGDLSVQGGATLTAGNTTVGGTANFNGSTVTMGNLVAGGNTIFTGGTNNLNRITSAADIELRQNAVVTIHERNVQATGAVRVLDTGNLTHCETTPTKTCGLELAATLVYVGPSASINVAGRGYVGAPDVGTPGRTSGNLTNNGAPPDRGGSYGGRGGGSPNYHGGAQAPSTAVYGNYITPSEPGGGGGFSQNGAQPGADGGGFVQIVASQSLIVDGNINANGNLSNSANNHFATTGMVWGGGGAGGGINIVTPALGGTGFISANGGNNANPGSAGAAGGGSGGRIAVKGLSSATSNFAPSVMANNLRAFGALGGNNRTAGAGTIYVRFATETFGSLIVDNNNASTVNEDSTPILLVPGGTVQNVSGASRTVGNFGANWPANQFVGQWFNPNVNQPQAATGLTEQIILPIVSHTSTQATLGGDVAVDLETITNVGATYRGVLMLDRLSVRRRADVVVNGDVLVLSGNVGSQSTTDFTMTGTLEALTIDLNTIATLTIQSGGIQCQELISNKNPAASFELNLAGTGATYQEPTTHVGNLNMGAGAALTTGDLFASGNVSITSATLNATNVSVDGSATFTSTSLNLGVLDVDGPLSMNGGNNTVGELRSGDEIELRGGVTVTVNADVVSAAAAVRMLDSGTTLQHCETTPAKTCRLLITAPVVSVGTGTVVNASGRGYVGSNAAGSSAWTSGNSTVNGAPADRGGSHGGRGNGSPNYHSGAPAPISAVYGNFITPSEGGGGGGFGQNGAQPGADGGGFIRIQASQTLVVDGTIQANGNASNAANNHFATTGHVWGAGGAGGGIDIVAGTLAGAGTIQANGGNNANPGSSGAAGGGGGGRIAIKGFSSATGSFAPTALPNNVRAFAGIGGNNLWAGAGTVYVRAASETYGALVVDNGGNNAFADSTPILLVPQGTVQALNDSGRTITDFGANWPTNQYTGTWISPNLSQPGVSSGMGNQTFFPVASHTTNQLTLGGTGSLAAVAAVSNQYRGALILDRLTVRRRADVQVPGDVYVLSGNLGAASGAPFELGGILECNVLDLNTANAIQIQGGGLQTAEVFGSASASFPFQITMAGVSGYGAIYQESTTHASSLTMGSGSTLTTGNLFTSGNLSVTSATLNTTNVTVGGTASLTSNTLNLGVLDVTGAIDIAGGNNTVAELRSGATIDIRNSATVTITERNVQAVGAVQLLDSGTTLQHCETTLTKVCSLQITAPTVYVAPGTTITATGRGYAGSPSTNPAYTAGNTTLNGAPADRGGSYGGRGGGSPNFHSGAQAPLAAVFGNFVNPNDAGGGGGYGQNGAQPGADGGGIIRIVANQGLVVDGTIQSNGNNSNSPNNHFATTGQVWGAGGAGGSVDLVVGTLAGAGTIQANGGNNSNPGSSAAPGGGGGGRIAVKGYTTTSGNFAPAVMANNLRAFGGLGGGNLWAGAGTIYLRSANETYGSLIVDNGGNLANVDSTPILLLPQGQAVTVGANTLTDFGASWQTDRFVGTWLNPDVNQPGAALGLTTQQFFRITAHTANQLTVAGAGFADVAQVGDVYRGVLALDRLTVRRRADVVVPGDVMVLSGNVGAAAGAPFVVDGMLEALRLDLNTTPSIQVSQGGLQVSEIIANADPSFAFDLTLGNSTSLTQTNTAVNNLTLGSGATLTTSALTATGDVNVTGGNIIATTVEVDGACNFTNPSTSNLGVAQCGTFDLNGGTLRVDALTTDADTTLRGNGQLTVWGAVSTTPNVSVGGNLFLQDTSRLFHAETTASQVYMLNVAADVVSVASGARIDATGRGYLGGAGTATGYTFPNTLTGGAPDRVGGSHGGWGASGSAGGTLPAAYGNLYDPMLPGGGGAANTSNNWHGTDGGGIIWLEAASGIICDGQIVADGNPTPNNQGTLGAGGAGGSIRIVSPLLNGAGTIAARGANGNSSNGGGGGGGRVSVAGVSAFGGNFAFNTIWNGIKAQGGTGWNTKRAGAGTIYVHPASHTYGSLVIDNENSSFNVDANSTPLTSLAGGTIAALPSNNVIQDNAGNFTANFFAGSWANPNIAQGNPSRRIDDQIFPVLTNTLNTITFGALVNLTTLTSVGQTYRGLYRFRNVEIRNRGQLRTLGDLVIEEGDIASGNTTTMTVPAGAGLNAQVIDLNLATITGTGTVTGTVVTGPL